jgi:hypothetical protein
MPEPEPRQFEPSWSGRNTGSHRWGGIAEKNRVPSKGTNPHTPSSFTRETDILPGYNGARRKITDDNILTNRNTTSDFSVKEDAYRRSAGYNNSYREIDEHLYLSSYSNANSYEGIEWNCTASTDTIVGIVPADNFELKKEVSGDATGVRIDSVGQALKPGSLKKTTKVPLPESPNEKAGLQSLVEKVGVRSKVRVKSENAPVDQFGTQTSDVLKSVKNGQMTKNNRNGEVSGYKPSVGQLESRSAPQSELRIGEGDARIHPESYKTMFHYSLSVDRPAQMLPDKDQWKAQAAVPNQNETYTTVPRDENYEFAKDTMTREYPMRQFTDAIASIPLPKFFMTGDAYKPSSGSVVKDSYKMRVDRAVVGDGEAHLYEDGQKNMAMGDSYLPIRQATLSNLDGMKAEDSSIRTAAEEKRGGRSKVKIGDDAFRHEGGSRGLGEGGPTIRGDKDRRTGTDVSGRTLSQNVKGSQRMVRGEVQRQKGELVF